MRRSLKNYKNWDDYVDDMKKELNESYWYNEGTKLHPYYDIALEGGASLIASLYVFPLFGISNPAFALALSSFRIVNNWINYVFNYSDTFFVGSGNGATGAIGTYVIRYWRYHVDDGTVNHGLKDGWIKSKFGNYWIRKNLEYPNNQEWYNNKYGKEVDNQFVDEEYDVVMISMVKY